MDQLELEMIDKIFVNLPVKDLGKSMTFFKNVGFSFNPQFTDATAACMVMSNDIYAMLLTHDKVKAFTNKKVADAHTTTEVLTALTVESRAKVHELADKALKAGGGEPYAPKDFGFMLARSFEDPGSAVARRRNSRRTTRRVCG